MLVLRITGVLMFCFTVLTPINAWQGLDSLLLIPKNSSPELKFTSDFILDHEFYKNRFDAKDLLCKVTDNRGEGCDVLYGTRNLRPILHGVAYRGGANNYFHRDNKRKNQNPLPDDGLKNLCSEGFSYGIYLYRENFETAIVNDTCNCINGAHNVLGYLQKDYFDTAHVRQMVELVYESAMDKNRGPVYLHCWNGWHASGYIAAVLLKQFCGYSDLQAINYWDLGTDGANKNPHYQKIRELIKDFKPYPQYQITDELGNQICPEMPTIIDSSKLHIDIQHLVLVPESIPVGYSIVLYNVSFSAGKTSFSSVGSNVDVQNLLKALQANTQLEVEIGGYTDNSGDASSNQSYSYKRAKFIYNYLISKGIEANRLTCKGYGELKPLYSNRTKIGKERNRRIEIKVLKTGSIMQGD